MDIYRLRLLLPLAAEFNREFISRADKLGKETAAALAELYGVPESETLEKLNLYIEYVARAYLDGLGD